MKNILIPFEFNKPSMEALKYAVALASKAKGSITLVYSFVLAYASNSLSATRPRGSSGKGLVSEGKHIIEARIARVKDKYKNSKCRLDDVVVMGHNEDALHKLVKSRNIDLIVMGNSSAEFHKTATHWIMQEIIKNSLVPVLLIKKAADISSVKQILFPSTLEAYQPRVIRQLKDIQKTFNATVHLLLVNTPDNFITEDLAEDQLLRFLKRSKLENCETHFYCYTSEGAGISRFTTKMNANMIVMPTHARQGLSRVFKGSVMERVLNDVKVPVVAVAM